MLIFGFGLIIGAVLGWLLAGKFPFLAQQHVHKLEAWWIRFKIRRKVY